MLKYVLQKLFDFILVTNSILKIQVLAIFIEPQAFALLLPMLGYSQPWRRLARQLNLLLGCLELNVPLKWHVRYHYPDIFRGNEVVIVEIIPIIKSKLV